MIRPYWPALSRLVAAVTAAQKRVETHQGVTDGSGNFTVVYAEPFPAPPHVSPVQLPQSDPNRQVRVTAFSETGFTVRVESRAALSVLGVGLVLGSATTPAVGAPVSVVSRET